MEEDNFDDLRMRFKAFYLDANHNNVILIIQLLIDMFANAF